MTSQDCPVRQSSLVDVLRLTYGGHVHTCHGIAPDLDAVGDAGGTVLHTNEEAPYANGVQRSEIDGFLTNIPWSACEWLLKHPATQDAHGRLLNPQRFRLETWGGTRVSTSPLLPLTLEGNWYMERTIPLAIAVQFNADPFLRKGILRWVSVPDEHGTLLRRRLVPAAPEVTV